MPLWNIYHPVGAYTAEEKKEMANRIADIYIIPRFYVGVLFHEQPKDSFYMGGEARGDFVRIRLDQFARH
ncbi:tautomerase family protein, partial [Cupriavidus sp. 8B]